jgi:hypothetical protein
MVFIRLDNIDIEFTYWIDVNLSVTLVAAMQHKVAMCFDHCPLLWKVTIPTSL